VKLVEGRAMNAVRYCPNSRIWGSTVLLFLWSVASWAQLTDRTQAPNTAKAGIAKSLEDEVGPGRGDANNWNSSIFIIQRDPFRSIRRGRQLFQRKFTRMQGQGANDGDGLGDLNTNGALGAGRSDSCGDGPQPDLRGRRIFVEISRAAEPLTSGALRRRS